MAHTGRDMAKDCAEVYKAQRDTHTSTLLIPVRRRGAKAEQQQQQHPGEVWIGETVLTKPVQGRSQQKPHTLELGLCQ